MRYASAVAALLAVPALALAQDAVKERLEKSPRHQEWVQIKNGDRTVHAYVVYPETKEKAPAIIVIHENRGLTDWVRAVADQLAEAGVIAIAPDLLSGSGPNGGKTSDFPNTDAAREAIGKLTPEQVTSDLNAAADYVTSLPASNKKVAVAGFCWGGGQSFRFATNRPGLAAAFVFYGPGPNTKEAVAKITAPVYGFYGGNDSRIGETIPGTASLMKDAGKNVRSSHLQRRWPRLHARGRGPRRWRSEQEGARRRLDPLEGPDQEDLWLAPFCRPSARHACGSWSRLAGSASRDVPRQEHDAGCAFLDRSVPSPRDARSRRHGRRLPRRACPDFGHRSGQDGSRAEREHRFEHPPRDPCALENPAPWHRPDSE
jgi:carboxymethylenebutenolidase